MGNHKSNWAKLTAAGKAEQSAHERERFSRRLIKAKYVLDLAAVNSNILACERAGQTLTARSGVVQTPYRS